MREKRNLMSASIKIKNKQGKVKIETKRFLC